MTIYNISHSTLQKFLRNRAKLQMTDQVQSCHKLCNGEQLSHMADLSRSGHPHACSGPAPNGSSGLGSGNYPAPRTYVKGSWLGGHLRQCPMLYALAETTEHNLYKAVNDKGCHNAAKYNVGVL